MSDVLYQARPSMWRTHPFGTLFYLLLLGLGGYIALTGTIPYLTPYIDPLPLPEAVGIEYLGYALIVLSLLVLLGWWLGSLFDHLKITQHDIVWTHGLLSKEYTETNMASVRTVRVNQSLLQRIVGAGDLVIFTTGDEPELSLRGLPRPNEIREHIKRQSHREV
jgi:uncharacterized membrane protein YdbT with pleckstrin-like domain